MDYFHLIEEAEFSSQHQNSNLGHWSPKLLPFPLYPEAYSDGLQFPAAAVLSVILSHVTFSQEDDTDEMCALLGPFLGEQNSPVPLSKAPGWGAQCSLWLRQRHNRLLGKITALVCIQFPVSACFGAEPAVICVQAWEVMALIDSCITI